MKEIVSQFEEIYSKSSNIDELLLSVCKLLQNEVSHYDWVGFYFKNNNKRELKLKAYAGLPTEHEIIPFGKGICGQVAESNKNFVVSDVNEQDNYISCNINVKSEIVIPLFYKKENIGQIDIDSNQINAFSAVDEELLTFINSKISLKVEEWNAYPIF